MEKADETIERIQSYLEKDKDSTSTETNSTIPEEKVTEATDAMSDSLKTTTDEIEKINSS